MIGKDSALNEMTPGVTMTILLAILLMQAAPTQASGLSQSVSTPPVIKVSTARVTRVNSTGPAVHRVTPAKTLSVAQMATLQSALDRNGFGIGLLDGQSGPRTQQALNDYARARGLTDSEARAELLADTEPATAGYTITADDLAQVGTAPPDWEEAAKVSAMACNSLDEVLLEEFHVSRIFLHHLNPGITNWADVTEGTEVIVPNTRADDWSANAARLEVDCRAFRIRAFDTNDNLVASFPCSIARKLHKVPAGDLTLVAFAPNPNYTFDPENFPESPRAQAIGRKLIIPPGPRNPVGVYWLSLSAPGFGMHGTPHPETIGRRESHGCFRLTNWDITTLAGMVEAGTPVRVMNVPDDN